MSKRKNHNSVFVLATLGVYLGLVLVGATPQVLAQAAMTRQFDVKDEIEFNDDLDTDPKEGSPTDAIENYFDNIEAFLDDLECLPREAVFPSLQKPFEIIPSPTRPYDANSIRFAIDDRLIDVDKASSHQAGMLPNALASILRDVGRTTAFQIRQQSIASSTFRSENDQVFIVTRLPRAGLDSLFA